MGETLLVVVGILIAIQINNWNETRQLKINETVSITALLSEFDSNKSTIERCKSLIIEKRGFADKLRKQIGPKKSKIEINQLNKLFDVIGQTNRCSISTDVLKDILNSGNLNIISNDKIRRSISKWSAILNELEREENEWAQEFSSITIPYLNRWILWEDVDYEGAGGDPRFYKSHLSLDPRLVLQEVEFANLLNNHYWRIRRAETRITSILQQTEVVIKLMRKELNIKE
ncbi:MAG: hypothetical protein COA86_17640 [Kangiella sp.]|nr:MAG: hypothetical protein COA86_17640 [Kangiella sp.]